VEGIFKGVAKALGEATFKSSKRNSIPSTKGIL
jgi:imidazoleglycerol phosphate dehydratase HisB